METIYFEEKQRFKEIAVYFLLGLLQILFLWGLIQQTLFNKPWGIKPSGDLALVIINIGAFMLILLFLSISLRTVITDNDISFRMIPFQIKERIIEWNEVKEVKVMKYDGFKDYWGFGRRFMPGKGWCYKLPGNYGIKLTLTNNKKILIGTHKANEISSIIDELKTKGKIAIAATDRNRQAG